MSDPTNFIVTVFNLSLVFVNRSLPDKILVTSIVKIFSYVLAHIALYSIVDFYFVSDQNATMGQINPADEEVTYLIYI